MEGRGAAQEYGQSLSLERTRNRISICRGRNSCCHVYRSPSRPTSDPLPAELRQYVCVVLSHLICILLQSSEAEHAHLRPNSCDSQARRQAPPAPNPSSVHYTTLPCLSSLAGFPICSCLVFGGEEIIIDTAAYMQEHVQDAAIHRRKCA